MLQNNLLPSSNCIEYKLALIVVKVTCESILCSVAFVIFDECRLVVSIPIVPLHYVNDVVHK